MSIGEESLLKLADLLFRRSERQPWLAIDEIRHSADGRFEETDKSRNQRRDQGREDVSRKVNTVMISATGRAVPFPAARRARAP